MCNYEKNLSYANEKKEKRVKLGTHTQKTQIHARSY